MLKKIVLIQTICIVVLLVAVGVLLVRVTGNPGGATPEGQRIPPSTGSIPTSQPTGDVRATVESITEESSRYAGLGVIVSGRLIYDAVTKEYLLQNPQQRSLSLDLQQESSKAEKLRNQNVTVTGEVKTVKNAAGRQSLGIGVREIRAP